MTNYRPWVETWNRKVRINLGSWETAHLLLPLANINTYFLLRAKWWLRGGVGGWFPRNLNWPKRFLQWWYQNRWSSVTLILTYIIHNQRDLTFSFTATKIRPKPTSQSPTPLSYWQNGKEIKVKNCNKSVNCKLHLIRALFKKHAAYTNKRRLSTGLGLGLPSTWKVRNGTSSKKKRKKERKNDHFWSLPFTIFT